MAPRARWWRADFDLLLTREATALLLLICLYTQHDDAFYFAASHTRFRYDAARAIGILGYGTFLGD